MYLATGQNKVINVRFVNMENDLTTVYLYHDKNSMYYLVEGAYALPMHDIFLV